MSNFSLFVLSFGVLLFILKVYPQDFRREISAIQLPRKVKLLLPLGQKELAGRPLECRSWSSESVLLGGDPGVNSREGLYIQFCLGEPWSYSEEAGKCYCRARGLEHSLLPLVPDPGLEKAKVSRGRLNNIISSGFLKPS